jgi:hypothetical protein
MVQLLNHMPQAMRFVVCTCERAIEILPTTSRSPSDTEESGQTTTSC